MFTDTHAHLDMSAFDGDRERVLERALTGGVTRMVTIGVDLDSSRKASGLADRHEAVYASVGLHPHYADHLDSEILKRLSELAGGAKVVGWGEIGLDFYRNRASRRRQIAAFEHQLDAAADAGLPVIIHDRDAHEEILDILTKREKQGWRGVIHCFSGDRDLAEIFVDMGFFLSIPGIVTYPQATATREVAAHVPLDRLLLETDSPYLAPQPRRGKRNEPFYLTYTAQKVAALRHIPVEELASQTSENATRLFGLPPAGSVGTEAP